MMEKYISPSIDFIEVNECDIIKTSMGTEGPVIDMDNDPIPSLDH